MSNGTNGHRPRAKRVQERSKGDVGARATALPQGMDDAPRLLRDIKEGRLDRLSLTASQRRACLLLMANGKSTAAELGSFFGVSVNCIRNDLADIRKELGREVGRWTMEEVLGRVVMSAEKYAAHAMKLDDPGLAWSIERDLVKLLQDLGVVESKGTGRDGPTMTITMEGLGRGYERARDLLTKAMDPRLTGMLPMEETPMVLDAEATLPVPVRDDSAPGDQGEGEDVCGTANSPEDHDSPVTEED